MRFTLVTTIPVLRHAVLRVGPTLLCAALLFGATGLDERANTRLVSLSPDTTEAPSVQRFLIRGTTEAQLGDYEEAIQYFETALDKAPNSPTLLQALADAHAAQGELTTALFYAHQARTHGADRPYYHRRLARLQEKAGASQAARETYRALLDRFPDQHRAYQALAALQEEMGRPEAALDTYRDLLARTRPPVAVYRNVLALQRRVGTPQGVANTLQALVDRRPNDPTYRRQLGAHYAEQGCTEAALDLLAPLVRQQPNDAALQKQVRRLSQETGHTMAAVPSVDSSAAVNRENLSVDQLVQKAQSAYDEAVSSTTVPDSARLGRAEALLQTALKRTSTHVPALDLLARIHQQTGNYREEATVLERALEENPRDAARWTRAATAYLRAHRFEKAASVAEEGLLLFPGEFSLARAAGFARLRSGDANRAADQFQEALNLGIDSASAKKTAEIHAGLGLAYTELDRPEDADSAFEAAQSLAPDHPVVLQSHAYGLALRGATLDHALKMARRAVELSPTDPFALDTLGWVYFQRDDLEAARRHLRRALNAGPSSARILEHFGDVHHALGNDTAAQKYWQRALDRAPDRPSLHRKLDEVSPS